MQPIIEIKTIQYMLAIEREGGFQKAAESLFISQPALSQYIKRVETELKTPLYYRSKGKCYLTEPGKVILSQGRQLLRQYNSMMEDVHAASNLKTVHLGWPNGYSIRVYMPLLSELKKTPNIKIDIAEESVESLTTKLLARKLDVIFVPSIYSHPNLSYETMNHEEFVLGIPVNHEANKIAKKYQENGYIDIMHMVDMPFLGIDAKAAEDFFNSLFRNSRKKPPICFRCDNWDRGCMIAAQGSCLIVVPIWYSNYDMLKGQLDFYRIKTPYHNNRVWGAVTRKDSVIQPETRAVIDAMSHLFGDRYAGEPVPEEYLISPFNY